MANTIIQEIKHIVEKFPRNFSQKLTKEQKDYIENNVDPKIKEYKFAMKEYWVLHDIHEFPKCENPNCPNHYVTKSIISIPMGYFEFPDRYRYCSIKCRCAHDENWKRTHSGPQKQETVQKRLATNNKLYGGNAPACSSKVVKKMKKTKEERYGDSGYNNHEKAAKTCEEKYGVVNVSQIEEVKKMKEETCLKNHGVKSFFQDPNWRKQVFEQVFGVDNPMKDKSIQEKSKKTCKKIYGTEYYFQSELYKSRWHEMSKLAHKKWVLCWNDNRYYSIYRRLGKIEDMVKGWEHYLQFDSRAEVMVYVFCNIEHDLGIIYQPQIIFKYEYDGKKYDYHPDFMLNGKIYEVKGEQFFKLDEETGKEVMQIPWRGNKTDEEYKWHCDKEEAKHQCMLANNVIILREQDIKNLSVDMFL